MRHRRHDKILRIPADKAHHIAALCASDAPPKPPQAPPTRPEPPPEIPQSLLPDALRTLCERISSLHTQVILDLALEVAQHITCAALELEPGILYRLIDRQLQGLRGVPVRLYAGARAYDALTREDLVLLKGVAVSVTREESDDPWSVRLEVPPDGHLNLGPKSQIGAVRKVWFSGDDSF